MALICVIVPVYKVEPFLRRCVDSILNQTFSDFELVLVEDGSPDNCGSICDEYARRDSRVTVIHQENKGVAVARNVGLDWAEAHSDCSWIMFADSDDWLQPQMLEMMLREATAQKVKICACSYYQTKGETVDVPAGQTYSELLSPGDLLQKHEIITVVPWGKLYARECFEGMRFPAGKAYEDEFFTYRVLFSCDQIALMPAQLYAYFDNSAGLTKKKWTPGSLDIFQAREEQLAFFRERQDETLYRVTLGRYLENAKTQYAMLNALPETEQYKKERELILQKIKALLIENHRHRQVDFWWNYEFLCKFYPVRTQLWRIFLAIKKRLGMKVDE